MLARGKSALVLVPEIGLTPQTIARFSERFDAMITVLHSNLTEKKRLMAWSAAQSGEARIVIGTRSAVFVPMPQLGLIVLDEEHDGSFKQQSGFRYHARDVAVMRASLLKIPVVLGSATPSLESLHNVSRDRYQLLKLSERINQLTPKIQRIDMRHQKLKAGLTEAAYQAIAEHLARDQQVMLFLNRRGFAPVLLCHECGWIQDCQRCDSYMNLHQGGQQLRCHHCDSVRARPSACPECGSEQLLPVGQGTERLQEEVSARFPEQLVLRMDRDSTRKKGSFESMLAQIHSGEAQILIGTQMLAKGHHFPKLSLVVIVDADGGLFSADFRAVEKFSQLLVQVAGRAGREQMAGEILIQTHQPDHPHLQTLIEQGYEKVAEHLLQERLQAELPPHTYLALLSAEALKLQDAETFLQQAREWLLAKQTDLSIWGPAPAAIEKVRGRYRLCLHYRHESRSKLAQLSTGLTAFITSLKSSRHVKWSLDVDPMQG